MVKQGKTGTEPSSQTDGGPAREEPSGQAEARDNPGVAANQEAGQKPDIETVIAERDRVLAEKAEIIERFQRAQAEFENARKHLEREKQEAREYAAMDLIRSLLPIVDDFERARKTPNLDPEFRKGLDLIHDQIMEVFARAGLRPVDEEGKFNPHFHHAVDKGPAESDQHDQSILEVYQRGYHFKDRLLRPAMVKVAVKEED